MEIKVNQSVKFSVANKKGINHYKGVFISVYNEVNLFIGIVNNNPYVIQELKVIFTHDDTKYTTGKLSIQLNKKDVSKTRISKEDKKQIEDKVYSITKNWSVKDEKTTFILYTISFKNSRFGFSRINLNTSSMVNKYIPEINAHNIKDNYLSLYSSLDDSYSVNCLTRKEMTKLELIYLFDNYIGSLDTKIYKCVLNVNKSTFKSSEYLVYRTTKDTYIFRDEYSKINHRRFDSLPKYTRDKMKSEYTMYTTNKEDIPKIKEKLVSYAKKDLVNNLNSL